MTYAQELDSLKRKALSVKLDEYFAAIEGEGTDVQKGEADFLIESGSDLSPENTTIPILSVGRDEINSIAISLAAPIRSG